MYSPVAIAMKQLSWTSSLAYMDVIYQRAEDERAGNRGVTTVFMYDELLRQSVSTELSGKMGRWT